MFHMHTYFHLKDGVTLERFRDRWDAFLAHLISQDLVVRADPIAARRTDTGLDTDEERSHSYFVIMSFRDRAQSEAAWAVIEPRSQPTESFHRRVFALVDDPIFSCWEDEG